MLIARHPRCRSNSEACSSCGRAPSLAPFLADISRWRRAQVVPAIIAEGLRLPDGVGVKHSTNLSLRRGVSAAKIFTSLSYNRAKLHAGGASRQRDAPSPSSPRLGGSTGLARHLSSSVFLCLGLPGVGVGPTDHAGTTYVFAEEAQLLPCFLPQTAPQALALAERAGHAWASVAAALPY